MNYYEHHIGDYIKATAHLSMLEDAAYRRLIDAYYTREAPLPADKKACQRLARAMSKPERDAVNTVLDEFFTLESDGWHQSRCDEEIAKYAEKKPAAEEKKENDKERQRKARERRKQLFDELSSHGINMPFNATTEELVTSLSRVTSRDESQRVTQHVTRDNTCTHTPDTNPHTPDTNPQTPEVNHLSEVTYSEPEHPQGDPQPDDATTRRKGELCKQLRPLNIDAMPHLQCWDALLQHSDDEILFAAQSAKARKPNERISLAYLVPILADKGSTPKPKPRENAWWATEGGIIAKGRELGIEARVGETMPEFKARINAKIEVLQGATA